MPLEIVTIPCLQDNYAFLARDTASGEVALIDAPEAEPILAALEARDWRLSQVWLTHHHWDHVDGLSGILAQHSAQVVGAAADAHRLPPLDLQVSDGDSVTLGATEMRVLDVSGHTIGHIAFCGAGYAFTADSLMALGCGRLFEGSCAQMWQSLQKLMALPRETVICSGHEYTASNARFAVTIDPQNSALHARVAEIERARAAGQPTVPSTLGEELDTNPFLRAADPAIAAHLGLTGAAPTDVFAEIRKRKDNF